MVTEKNGTCRLYIFAVAFLLSCASSPERSVPMEKNEENNFKLGSLLLADGKFLEALESFRKFETSYPVSIKRGAVLFHEGEALEGLGRQREAIEKYKGARQAFGENNPEGEAQSLYRMSICYEALSEDASSIVVLKQLELRKNKLDPPMRGAELPARLAATYSRLGEKDLADEYFKTAVAGLSDLQKNANKDTDIWMPKTYFSMGQMSLSRSFKDEEELHYFGINLEKGQIWLLRAVEYGDNNPWSIKAKNQIVSAYENILKFLRTYSVNDSKDSLVNNVSSQEIRKKGAIHFFNLIGSLKKEKANAIKGKPRGLITNLFDSLGGIEKNLEEIINEPDVRGRLTDEAERKEGIKRELK